MNEKDMLRDMTLYGDAGFLTNPDSGKHKGYIVVNGEKCVCLAQAGECRSNNNFYTLGLGDAKSWTTPIIDKNCPTGCQYFNIVHDNHKKRECKNPIKYFPQYNKYGGQFVWYCKNLKKLEVKPKKRKG